MAIGSREQNQKRQQLHIKIGSAPTLQLPTVVMILLGRNRISTATLLGLLDIVDTIQTINIPFRLLNRRTTKEDGTAIHKPEIQIGQRRLRHTIHNIRTNLLFQPTTPRMLTERAMINNIPSVQGYMHTLQQQGRCRHRIHHQDILTPWARWGIR